MQSKIAFLALGLLFVFCTATIAQPPGIDGNRWTNAGGIALTQSQGFAQGDPMRLTWGFASDGTSIPSFGAGAAGSSNLIARMDAIYGAGPGGPNLTLRPWFSLYQGVFDRWSSISGLSYQYEANDDGAAYSNSNGAATRGLLGTRADVRIGGRAIDGNNGILGFNFFPNVGDMVIDTNDSFFTNTSSGSIRLRNVVSHEHGHGLGMSHVFASNSRQLMEPAYSGAFDGPQFHDILVAQRAYGDANEKSFGGLGNDVAARATALGTILVGTQVAVGNSARTLVVPPTAVDFVSIDDASDIDFWSFTVNGAGTVDILLESLGFSYFTQPQDPNTGGPTGTNLNFNTRLRSDLALTLFDTNGTTPLFTANATSFGGNEFIDDFLLTSAGTYFVRITGLNNSDSISLDTQFYGLTVGFTAIPEPATAILLAIGGIALATTRRRRR